MRRRGNEWPSIADTVLARVLLLSAFGGEVISCVGGQEVVREGVTLNSELRVEGPCRVILRKLTVRGNRATAPQGQALPPSDRRFADQLFGQRGRRRWFWRTPRLARLRGSLCWRAG